MKVFIYFFAIFFLFVPLPAIGEADGCGTAYSKFPRPKENIFSLSQDVELGKKLFGDAEPELTKIVGRPVKLVSDEILENYLKNLSSKILDSSPEEAREFQYSFAFYDFEKADAKALPGGIILVSLGSFIDMPSDDAMVFMLAHEIGHIYLRHHTRSLTLQYARRAMDLLVGITANRLKEASKSEEVSQFTKDDVTILEFSQKELQDMSEYPNTTKLVHETEADIFSAAIGTNAGFRTGGIVKFHRSILKGSGEGWMNWDSYPNNLVRALIYECISPSNPIADEETLSPELKEAKAHAKKILTNKN